MTRAKQPAKRVPPGADAAQLPARLRLHWPGEGVEMCFRWIVPQQVGGVCVPFRMGGRDGDSDEEPAHLVRLAGPFWLAETPVTQAQFAIWTRAAKIEHENRFKDRPKHPAENMDWRQAQRFCAWLSGSQPPGFPAGFRACLPTEAEWEYACRAGTDTEYHTGEGEAALRHAGWFGEDWDQGATHPVGEKQANIFGLWDMHGNVWEWCHDVWAADAYRRRVDGDWDPGAVVRAKDWASDREEMLANKAPRVLRGGSWGDSAWFCRSAVRNWNGPDVRNRGLGFRVCLVPGPASQFRAIEAAGERRPAR